MCYPFRNGGDYVRGWPKTNGYSKTEMGHDKVKMWVTIKYKWVSSQSYIMVHLPMLFLAAPSIHVWVFIQECPGQ
jgi:hypothetical protein